MEKTILESSIRQLAPKPRFGKAPSAESIERAEQLATAKRVEIVARHLSEVEKFVPPAPESIVAAASAATAVPVSASAAAAAADSVSDGEDNAAEDEGGAGGAAGRKGNAARRRERKDARLASVRAAAMAEADSASTIATVKARDAEAAALVAQLRPLGFSIVPVIGDGHCLFRAVAMQLVTVGGAGSGADFMPLRRRAADVIRIFWEDFAPFLPYVASDGYSEEVGAARAAVGAYCDRIATTNCWGGHPEVRALAFALGCPILIYQAHAAPTQFLPRGEEQVLGKALNEGAGGAVRHVLRLSFHLHSSGAGEHYNSCIRI